MRSSVKHESQKGPQALSGTFSHFRSENPTHEEFTWPSHELEPRPFLLLAKPAQKLGRHKEAKVHKMRPWIESTRLE